MTADAVLRPLRADDAVRLWQLLGPNQDELTGMASLPASPPKAEEMVAASVSTLQDLAAGSLDLVDGQQRHLGFVLEDRDTAALIGVTGISMKPQVTNLAVSILTSDDGVGLVARSWASPWTRTELDGTFLAPEVRGRRHGTLLSRGRLMFMHIVSPQIPNVVATHIRGVFDEDGTAPFWRSFGSQFASEWRTSKDAEGALQRNPGDIAALHDRTVELNDDLLRFLGPVNLASRPAFHLLRVEGLEPNGMYDPVDGGPTLTCTLKATTSAKQRAIGVAAVSNAGADSLVSTVSIPDFAATRSPSDVHVPGHIGVPSDVVDRLGAHEGSLLASVALP